jgi:aminoglycoside phosphotransferase (APT) family kinase protein
MIESYVEGPSGDTFSAGEQRSAWREIGTLLKRIHTVPVGGFGEELRDMSHGGSTNWNHYLDYNLAALGDNDPLLTKEILDKSTQQRLKSSFEKLKSIPMRFGLSHGDMSLKNVISHGGRLHVIDWGEANAHFVPQLDFGVILEDSLDSGSPEFAQLLAGYELDLDGFEALESEINALRLLIRTDKVRWALDRKPERVAGRASDLKRFMERVAW